MANQDNQPPRQTPGDGGEPPRPPSRMSRGAFTWLIVFAVALMLLVMFQNSNAGLRVDVTNFWSQVRNGNVKKVEIISSDELIAELDKPYGDEAGSKKIRVSYPLVGAEGYEAFYARLQQETREIPKVVNNQTRSLLISVLAPMIPWLLLFGVLWFVFLRGLRQSANGAGMLGNFGRSRHRMTTREHTAVTFADVAGVDEAKDEVQEIVEFLRNPKRFQKLGGRIPRGVLLVGEPGCGKTLLAKAIAGEAEVPFFSISGSDFVEMFVGVGASRVRDLFRQAKENAPCIIFLDEIDAVGRRRGVNYSGGGHDEREQTLNAILVEMDGFDSNDQVIVIAATNRADVLDPALVRPGRFDRQVFVPLPDVKGRFEILKVHGKKVKMAPPLEPKLQRLARATPMFSGADLAAVINESALLATLAGKDAIELEDLEEARDKVRWGRAKRSRVVEERDRELTAYHEAGHALVQSLMPEADPVHKVSIIPRGPYGGATFSLPEKDRMTVNRSYVDATLRVLCAGRLAEAMLGHDMNSGAAGDIRQATSMAKRMITDWGMSDRLGFVFYGDENQREFDMGQRDYSETTSQIIDEEVKRIIDVAYTDTQRILDENRDKLEAIAQALMKYETLDGEEVRAIIRGEEINRPSVAELIEAERRQRDAKPPLARPANGPPLGPEGPAPAPA